MKIERPHKSKEKYGLRDIKVGKYKDYSHEVYSKLRQACHFNGKKHDMVFTTRKLEKVIRVYRVS